MLRRFLVPVVMLLLAALVAAPVLAQEEEQGERRQRGQRGQRGFGGFGAGGGTLALLMAEPVQAEIELIDEQKAELTQLQEELAAERQGQFEGLQDLSDEERQARFTEMREKAEARTKEIQQKIESEILLPPQVERLKQINVQVRGIRALGDEEVAAALGITDDQKAELTAIQEESREKMGELFGGFGGQGGQDRPRLSDEERQANREKMTALRAESEEMQLAVLTDEQKAHFEQMKGEPVSFDIAELQRGRGFGGGFGQGGRGRRRGGDEGQPNEGQPNENQN